MGYNIDRLGVAAIHNEAWNHLLPIKENTKPDNACIRSNRTLSKQVIDSWFQP